MIRELEFFLLYVDCITSLPAVGVILNLKYKIVGRIQNQ